MLVRRDATFIDEATNRAERIFPDGTGWLNFQSRLPPMEVFRDSVLDGGVGAGGELALATFANAEWQNWTSTIQVASFELATRVGLPVIEGRPMGAAIASIFDAMPISLSQFSKLDDPLVVVPALLKNTALQVVQLLAATPSLIAQVVAQVISTSVWIVDVIANTRGELLGKDIALPPLQSVEPATDSWQVNRVFEVLRKQGTGEIQFPDGSLSLASNADYTSFFIPAYKFEKPWKIQWREGGVAAQQGDPQVARASGPGGEGLYQFNPGDASTFGFMPGTGTMLRVLQASYRFYGTLRGNPVDRFALRCRAVDRGCWKSTKAFDGSRDCRQCVTAESVWPIQGVGWAYGGVQLNVTTPGENVGEFYSATNKLIGNILELASRPGPLLYTLDVTGIHAAWKQSFENFWEFMRAEWHRYHGWGWRGLLSRLATLMVAFEDEGTLRLGGRFPAMPRSLVTSPRDDAEFTVGFEHSIFKQVIEPYCADLLNVQRFYLHSTEIAYVPPGAGALYTAEGKVKSSPLAKEFLTARSELLGSTKRMLVDLRRVVDPEYRRELVASGVKVSPLNPMIQGSPGTQVLTPDDKPRRAPTRPKGVRVPPLAGANELVRRAPPRAKTKPERAPTEQSGKGLAIGLAAAASVAAIAGVAWFVSREDEDEPESD